MWLELEKSSYLRESNLLFPPNVTPERESSGRPLVSLRICAPPNESRFLNKWPPPETIVLVKFLFLWGEMKKYNFKFNVIELRLQLKKG